jgi:hypothetical protein
MGIVVSMLLIAVGAVMRFAVTVKGHGFNVHTTGVILIIVGIVGAILSIVYWASWGGFRRGGVARSTTVVSSQGPSMNGERPIVREHEVQ